MRIFGFIVLNLLLSALIIFGVTHYFGKSAVQPTSESAQELPPSIPNFNILTLHQGSNTRQIQSCQAATCQILSPPEGVPDDAVTDGANWYYYQSLGDGKDRQTVLQQTSASSRETKTIIEQTNRVQPRGLFISPDNQKIAFWLDNIDDPKKDLTELWLYDAAEGGTKVIAEKIVKSAVVTEPKWNKSSTHLWFIGDTAEPKEDPKLELLLVAIQPPAFTVAFPSLPWGEFFANQMPAFDISADGKSLALAESSFFHQRLTIINDTGRRQSSALRGDLAYLQYLPDRTLIYIVQDNNRLSVWRQHDKIHRRLAQFDGPLISARTDPANQYLLLLQPGRNDRYLTAVVDIEHKTAATLPAVSQLAATVLLVQAKPTEQRIAGAADDYSDEEIAAFLDKNLAAITAETTAVAKRLVVTDQLNTVYLDYTLPDHPDRRLLLAVNDVLHDEWTVLASFQDRGGEWVRLTGDNSSEPKPLRLYEWEANPAQWILKKSY